MQRMGFLLLAMALVCAAPAWSSSKEGKETAAAKKNAGMPAAKTKSGKKTAQPTSPTPAAAPGNAAIASELAQLQEMIQAQSKQIQAQQKQIEDLQRQITARTPQSAAFSVPGAPVTVASTGLAPAPAPAVSANVEPATTVAETSVALASSAATPANTTAKVALKANATSSSATQEPQKLPEGIELAGGTIKLGFTVYGDWAWYANSSYGPQFETQVNQPGPGNNNFNSFDINRAYINFFYTPHSGAYTIRVTPNIYRDIGGQSNVAFGNNAQVSPSANGSLNLRLKYAYVQFNHPFGSSPAFGKDVITLGQTTNPLIDWQEAFYGYRFTSLVPWNYISLSSTHMGAKIGGPVMANGKMYLDYEAGVFDSGSFHNQEVAAEKQVMARVSFYPFGGKPRFGGFDLSAFVDFGYANKAPDQQNTSTNSLYRTAFWAGYSAEHFALLGEYDYGKNAFSAGNFYSGSAPIPTDPTYGYLASEASSILTSSANQRGFDFFGHVDIPHSPFALFGLYQYFQPNTNISKDPLDFARVVGGISYKYDSHLMFALDSQNLLFTHGQFTYGTFANAVPPNINALFLNAQFNY